LFVAVVPPAPRAGRRWRECHLGLPTDAFGNRIALAADEFGR
jgi:hypothetical protein